MWFVVEADALTAMVHGSKPSEFNVKIDSRQ